MNEELEFDCISVPVWVDSREDGAKILTGPNVPTPLHGMNPRTVMGVTAWDHMRKRCYYEAGYKCQACGKVLGKGQCHAHELYTINYITGESKFSRVVCLCEMCHVRGYHSGRMLTMFKKGNPLMPKAKVLEGVENLFRLLHEYNEAHPDEPDLRAYATFIDYAKWPPIREEMLKLIEKYNIKFYKEDSERMAHWNKWRLSFGTMTYGTPYKDRAEWEEAMRKNDAKNHNAAVREKSEVDLEIEKILDLT